MLVDVSTRSETEAREFFTPFSLFYNALLTKQNILITNDITYKNIQQPYYL